MLAEELRLYAGSSSQPSEPFRVERSDVLANNKTVLVAEVGVVLEVGDPVTKLLTSSLSNSPASMRCAACTS